MVTLAADKFEIPPVAAYVIHAWRGEGDRQRARVRYYTKSEGRAALAVFRRVIAQDEMSGIDFWQIDHAERMGTLLAHFRGGNTLEISTEFQALAAPNGGLLESEK